MTDRWWAELDGLLVPAMFYGVLVVALFALLFRWLPGNPGWASAGLYVALAVVMGAAVRAGVLARRMTR